MKKDISFGEFMAEVVNRADQISFERSGRPLSDKYDSPSTIIKMIGAVSNTGWGSFTALSGIIANPTYFDFAAAAAAFMLNPTGMIVLGSLVYWGGKESIKQLYNNRTMVADIRTIGDRYEQRYQQCSSSGELDALLNEAALDLYNL